MSQTSKLPRIVLAISALVFLSFGFVCMFWPQAIMGLAHIELSHPSALTEIRAFYGGLELGLGAFLVHCVVNQRHLSTGLWLCVLIMSGIVIGRLIGVATDGTEGLFVYLALGLEAPLLGFCSYGLLVSLRQGTK